MKKKFFKKEEKSTTPKDDIVSVNFKPSESKMLKRLNEVAKLNRRPRSSQIKLYIEDGLANEPN